ncbi:arylesterase [Mesorhizobium sp. B2-3-14]|uniref:Lysophospholipase L1-like esterase n=1 Tax=Mesorhizobium australicum (strain HAMBI 3006 / LMG 24608 / WSM2073) TaxID=754035 RepID=L0KDT3_MESAW|nr:MULTISPECIES: arylesterase [Mesorhizobium]MBZ9930831.1 arylesterase [Mesorhizobium sp. BR1-1-5]AGB43467.1 lysophospholipase L1-like esterase [Mesorhizobium australicum WSM2073]MBZ9696074.1 arylesterase [Mesorhizobium sp. CO1-1-9]MBZ9909002.1 arylesterase [Mesorhizobium sp. BR115XR7A]TPJ20248.1 arylesterase [Mesorhizobium sp. B2-7-3]
MSFKRRFAAGLVVFLAICGGISSARAAPFKIVGFGDSLMAGYGLGPGEGFTDKLQAALRAKGHDVIVANAGVSGDTSSGGLARLDWSVPEGTQLVILELGANDMLRGVAPDITKRNLDEMLGRLKERKIAVLLAGMRAAPNLGADYQSAFDAIFADLAGKYDVPLYPFFLDGVAGQPGLQLEDGLHPSARGVDLMVERILPTVEKAMAAAPGGS